MVGLEVEPDACGEICIVEVFGDTLGAGPDGMPLAGVGQGVKALSDPRLTQDFAADPYPIDVAVDHRYAVEWRPGRAEFFVDGVSRRTVTRVPDYPLQLILGVFDFPDRASADQTETPVPELSVRRVHGSAYS